MTTKLEEIELCLRILHTAAKVELTGAQLAKIRHVALEYLNAELGEFVGEPDGE